MCSNPDLFFVVFTNFFLIDRLQNANAPLQYNSSCQFHTNLPTEDAKLETSVYLAIMIGSITLVRTFEDVQQNEILNL